MPKSGCTQNGHLAETEKKKKKAVSQSYSGRKTKQGEDSRGRSTGLGLPNLDEALRTQGLITAPGDIHVRGIILEQRRTKGEKKKKIKRWCNKNGETCQETDWTLDER